MQFELKIIQALQTSGGKFWDLFFKAFSELGTTISVFLVAIILFLCKKRWPAFWLLVLEGVGYLTGFALKLFVSRERPYDVSTEIEAKTFTDGYSMPSGHSICAIIMAIVLVYVFWKDKKNWQRTLMVLTGIAFVALMGISRMYLGQHYLTDVLVGYVLGYCVCLVAYWLASPTSKLCNILLERMGLEKWKMQVPPMPKIYDDVLKNSRQNSEKVEKIEKE